MFHILSLLRTYCLELYWSHESIDTSTCNHHYLRRKPNKETEINGTWSCKVAAITQQPWTSTNKSLTIYWLRDSEIKVQTKTRVAERTCEPILSLLSFSVWQNQSFHPGACVRWHSCVYAQQRWQVCLCLCLCALWVSSRCTRSMTR